MKKDDFKTTKHYECDVCGCSRTGNNAYDGWNYCDEHYKEIEEADDD